MLASLCFKGSKAINRVAMAAIKRPNTEAYHQIKHNSKVAPNYIRSSTNEKKTSKALISVFLISIG